MKPFDEAVIQLADVDLKVYLYDLVYTFFLRYKSFKSTYLDHFGIYADSMLEAVTKAEEEGIESVHSVLQTLKQERKDLHLTIEVMVKDMNKVLEEQGIREHL